MRLRQTAALALTAATLLLAACTGDDATTTHEGDGAATTGTSSAPSASAPGAPADAPHPADATPATHEGDESATVDYLCPNGLTFTVEYGRTPATWATLTLDGQRYHLEQAIAASGIRYEGVGSGYQVWSKGLEAMLHLDGELIEEACAGTER